MFKITFKLLLMTVVIFTTSNMCAKKNVCSTYKVKSSSKSYKKSYAQPKIKNQKCAYEGLGKTSAHNGSTKIKVTNGHMKRTSHGYKYVQPYARSK